MAKTVDVTIRGKNETGKAFKQAAGEADSFGKRIAGLVNPVNLLKGALASLGAAGFGMLARKSIEAASSSDAAWGRVQSAVENAGITFRLVQGQLDGLFAAIQRTTRFSDDQASDAFTELLTISNDYAGSIKNLTLVTDLAVAKQIDLKTAAQLVGRAMLGDTSTLKRYGVIVRENEDAIATLGDRFRGFAERDATTLEGQLKQVANAWDNVLEAMGRAISGLSGGSTVTGAMVGTLNDLSQWIDENKSSLNDLGKSLAYILGELGKLAAMPIQAGQGYGEVGSVLADAYYRATNWLRGKDAKVPLDLEDAGSFQYYEDLGRIRARSRQQRQREIAANTAAAAARPYESPFSARDRAAQDKAFGQLMGDIRSEAKPTVGQIGEGRFHIPGPGAPPPLDFSGTPEAMGVMRAALADLDDAIRGIAKGSMVEFADSWAMATQEIVSGSAKIGPALERAAKRAVGSVLIAKGRETLLDAAKSAVMGFTNPAEFLKAAKLFGIGTAQMALGQAFAGGTGGGGGAALGGGSFASQSSDLNANRGTGTIIVQGGLLDMSDPRQRDAFEDALNTMHGLRVVVQGG